MHRRKLAEMTDSTKVGLAGSAFGVVAGGLIAAAVMSTFPGVGHPMRMTDLWRDLGWAVFFSSPWGLIAGAILGGYLYERSRDTMAFRQLVLEAVVLTVIVTTLVTQLIIPSAWNLPRVTVTAVAVLTSAVLSVVGALLLKPLYWRK
jgi:hypothetical protein